MATPRPSGTRQGPPPLAPTFGGRFVDAVLDRIGRVPTTQLRQLITYGLIVGTGLVYLALAIKYALIEDAKQWEPSALWLGTLLTLSGLDATQFFAKRKTDAEYITALQSGATVPTATVTTTATAGPAVTTTTEGAK